MKNILLSPPASVNLRHLDIPSQGHADRLPVPTRGETYRGIPQKQSPHRPLALGHYPGTSPSRIESPSPPRYRQGGTSRSRDRLEEKRRSGDAFSKDSREEGDVVPSHSSHRGDQNKTHSGTRSSGSEFVEDPRRRRSDSGVRQVSFTRRDNRRDVYDDDDVVLS